MVENARKKFIINQFPAVKNHRLRLENTYVAGKNSKKKKTNQD